MIISRKVKRQFNGESIVLSTKLVETPGCPYVILAYIHIFFSLYISLIYTTHLIMNHRPTFKEKKIIELLEENIRENLCDLG